MTDFFKNWKTSGAALVASLVGLGVLFFPEHREWLAKFGTALLAFVTALGFFFSKDGDKTGTTGNPR